MTDSLLVEHPWRVLHQASLLRGRIPLWNPYILSGAPHLAEVGSCALYPFSVVFDLWDPEQGVALNVMVHLAAAGFLMFLFLRKLGLDTDAAVIGGTAFEFNGFFLVNVGSPIVIFSAAWSPLILLGITDLVRSRQWRSGWPISLGVFMAFLGGFPFALAMTLVVSVGWVLFCALSLVRDGRPVRTVCARLATAGVAVLLGLGLAGVVLVPLAELMGLTSRQEVTPGQCQFVAMPVVTAIQAVVPDFFGNPVEGAYWLRDCQSLFNAQPASDRMWRWNYTSQNLYSGIVPLVLSIWAVFCRRSRDSLFFAGLACLALLAMFGALGVVSFLHATVPPFNYSRPDRMAFVYMLAVSVLAAHGFSWVADRRGPRIGPLWLSWVLVSLPVLPELLGLAVRPERRLVMRRFVDIARVQIGRPAVHFQEQVLVAAGMVVLLVGTLIVARAFARMRKAVGAAVVLLTLLPMLAFGWGYNPTQPSPLYPDAPAMKVIRNTSGLYRVAHFGRAMSPNTNASFTISSVGGVSTAPLERYIALVRAADPKAIQRDKYFLGFGSTRVLETRLLDFLNVELFLSSSPLPYGQLEYVSPSSDFFVYRNPRKLERFFLVNRIETVADPESAVDRVLDPSFDPSSAAVVASGESPELDTPTAHERVDPGEVTVTSYGAHEIVLEVQAKTRGVLVSSEVDYPGWRASVDGEPARVLRVNTAFRGVQVDPGYHRVRFSFLPRSLFVGLGLSVASLMVLLGLVATERRLIGTRVGTDQP